MPTTYEDLRNAALKCDCCRGRFVSDPRLAFEPCEGYGENILTFYVVCAACQKAGKKPGVRLSYSIDDLWTRVDTPSQITLDAMYDAYRRLMR